MTTLRLRLVYDGVGPVHWSGGAGMFGLQDKAGVLHAGTPGPGGAVEFGLALQVKDGDAPVLSGAFAHGPPAARFLYLGWREPHGGFAQRLKLSLSDIAPADLRAAIALGAPLVATLRDHHPKATSNGANIGGTRAVTWSPA